MTESGYTVCRNAERRYAECYSIFYGQAQGLTSID